MWAGNVFAPLNLEGDMWLGGDDFDKVLVDRAIAHVKDEYGVDPTGDARFMAEIKKVAQRTKERLSSARTADLILAGALRDEDGDYIDVEIEITREEYERMITPLIDRTLDLVKTALKNAEMTVDQIDCVLMAGNSTCIPLVQQKMEKMFGQDKILRTVHPKHCVALGAGIVATRTGGIICQAPDPSDAERECGHLNNRDATECEKCGAALVLAESDEEADGAGSDNVIEIGGLAPFCYGMQSAGDVFTPFIDKNERYPTENPKTQTFYTQTPNQRMIAILVFGGDHMEQASLNEKQGEAFAVLPPGLKAESPIRIRIWLDSDGVFDLSAVLEDGRRLQTLLLQGNKGQKAVEAIQRVEESLNNQQISPDRLAEVEAARNDAFAQLQRMNFDGALERAKQAEQALAAGEETNDLASKAETLIRFAEHIVHEYSWAFDANQVYLLNGLVEETRQALIAGDQAVLQDKVDALDRATDSLPEALCLLLGLTSAVNNRIRPADPVEGEKLMRELADVRDDLSRHAPGAPAKLAALAEKVSRAIDGIQEAATPPSQKCPTCGAETTGKRFCPNNHDQWQLVAKSSGADGAKVISSSMEL